MTKLKKVLNHLNKVKDKYEDLRSHIADDFNDDIIDRALKDIEKLKELRETIKYLENLEVVIKEETLKVLEEG